jgi:hypothetical protein
MVEEFYGRFTPKSGHSIVAQCWSATLLGPTPDPQTAAIVTTILRQQPKSGTGSTATARIGIRLCVEKIERR